MARAPEVTLSTLRPILEFCRDCQVRFLIARCSASEIRLARTMEEEGFRLADTQLHFFRALARPPLPERDANFEVRPVSEAEIDILAEVAASAFRDYRGHYHEEPRLAQTTSSAEIYSSWAVNSWRDRQRGGNVWLAWYRGKPVAFICSRRLGPQEADLGLAGAIPAFIRRAPVMQEMINEMLIQWKKQGLVRVRACILLTNISIHRILVGLDFRLVRSVHTFHFWFPDDG